ncbi:hypothetical protein GEMRC1_001788 [Eukaryota sp. GEM-RC1]
MDSHHAVIEAITSELSELIALLEPSILVPLFGDVLLSILNSIGYTGGSLLFGTIRNSVMRLLVQLGDESVIAKCLSLFEEESIDADIKVAVYTAFGLQSMENFKKLMGMTKSASDDALETSRLLRSLGHAADTTEKVELLWEFSLSDNVRSQDWTIPMRSLGSRHGTGTTLWRLFSSQFDSLLNTIPQSILTSGFSSMFDSLTDSDVVEEMKVFFTGKELPFMRMTIPQVVERVSVNIEFVDRFVSEQV